MSSKNTRRRLNIRAQVLIVGLVIIAIAGVIAFVSLNLNNAVQVKVAPIHDAQSYSFSSNGVVFIKGSMLHFDDLNNESTNWSFELLDDNFSVTSSDNMIAVYNERVVQAISFQGQALFPLIEFSSSRVESVRCGENYMAVLRKNPNGEESISLINRTGTQLDPLSISNAKVLAYDYYGLDQLWVMTVNTDSGSIATTISTYSGGEAITGVMSMEGELIESIYPSGGMFYAAGTNTLHAYSTSGKEEARRHIYGWEVLDHSVNSNGNYFLLRPRNMRDSDKSSPALYVSLPSVDFDTDLRLPPQCIGVFIISDRITAVTQNTIYIYNSDGSIYKELRLDFPALNAEKLDDGRVLLQNDSQSMIVSIDVS